MAGMPGGKHSMDIHKEDTQNKAKRAFELMNDAEGKAFVALEHAASQVVSGVNYFFTFVRKHGEEYERCVVKYYHQAWTNTENVTVEKLEKLASYQA